MTLKKTALALGAVALAWLSLSGAAMAATTPTVKLDAASKVSTASAALNATINPGGDKTTYYFTYGPTTALGTTSASHTLAAGTKDKAVFATVGALQSGTTYYYAVTAVSLAGSVTSKQLAFKTAGNPPPGATTGGATVISSSSITFTGVVAPNDAATSYSFNYGTTSALGTQTAAKAVPASTSGVQVPVSVTLTGLEPGTTFYYQLVTTHGGTNTTAGAINTVVTYPSTPSAPPVGADTTPGAVHHGPFTFTTSGHITNHTSFPQLDACYGTVTIAFDHARKRVYAQTVPLSTSCTFSAGTTFSHLPIRLPRGVRDEHLVVYVRFNGNGYLGVHDAKPQTVELS